MNWKYSENKCSFSVVIVHYTLIMGWKCVNIFKIGFSWNFIDDFSWINHFTSIILFIRIAIQPSTFRIENWTKRSSKMNHGCYSRGKWCTKLAKERRVLASKRVKWVCSDHNGADCNIRFISFFFLFFCSSAQRFSKYMALKF